MKQIKEEITNEIVINKSKFITILKPVSDVKEINEHLENIKKKYKDATHYCYAYIIKSNEKCSDDGEPGGTAGMPILNILKINNLNNVLCIVIRYFGGIKLGAGGLVRAYSNSVQEALKKAKIGEITEGYTIILELDYQNIKNIDFILKPYDVKKEFNETIKYTFKITKEEFNNIEPSLKNYCNIKEKKNIDMDLGQVFRH